MPKAREELVACALHRLTPAELARAIVYVEETPLAAGTQVRMGDIELSVPWPALMLFADLEPAANWGHACRYWFMNLETAECREMNARFPPFLKGGVSPTLRVAWQGPNAPAWAVATPP